jgi:TPP-dependent pyruvate/acetoin dehydrogenase alpha subunit
MNFASAFQVPCVFFCQNNQWAISVPREQQMNSETVAQKAIAYGMPTTQVDGNDLFAVYKVSKEAIERARAGGGPSFIEAVTYRLGDHTTADDARRYRDPAEVEAWMGKDPMIRLKKYLTAKGIWNDEKQRELDQVSKDNAQKVVDEAFNIAKPSVTDIFDYTYAAITPELEVQKRTMRTHSLGQGVGAEQIQGGAR